MIQQQYITKAQDYIEKELDGYCDPYMIEMAKALIDDKATDSRFDDARRVYEAMDNIHYFLSSYLNGRDDVAFVIKPMPQDHISAIANTIMDILSGRG